MKVQSAGLHVSVQLCNDPRRNCIEPSSKRLKKYRRYNTKKKGRGKVRKNEGIEANLTTDEFALLHPAGAITQRDMDAATTTGRLGINCALANPNVGARKKNLRRVRPTRPGRGLRSQRERPTNTDARRTESPTCRPTA